MNPSPSAAEAFRRNYSTGRQRDGLLRVGLRKLCRGGGSDFGLGFTVLGVRGLGWFRDSRVMDLGFRGLSI